ncbi:MAG: aldehyde ferredoxin oxidoreductase N-terminal domain-containing protein [Candidatus Hodarchaeales archaeon]
MDVVTYDLTEEKVLDKKTLPKDIEEKFLGGRGVNVYLAFHSIPTDASPRGSENRIILGTGVLTGTSFPSAGMIASTFKSPHTNTLFTSVALGNLGAYLKNAKIDFLQISGKCKRPSYIFIDEFHDISLKNAEEIWDKSIEDSDKWLRKKYGEKSCIATIGPAAINQIVYAGVSIDREFSFQRGGLGSVFSSKNLKAIVVTEPPKLRQFDNHTTDLINSFFTRISSNIWFNILKNRGSFGILLPILQKKLASIKNGSKKLNLDPSKISEFSGYDDRYNCWKCPINCKKNSYQAFQALGLNLKIIDNASIQQAITKCDKEALDPLSTGAALASLWNIQDERRKLLDTDLGFRWGDPTIYSLIDSIINRKDLGDKLARGEIYLYKQTGEPSPCIKNQIPGFFYYPSSTGLTLAASTPSFNSSIIHSDYMIFPEILGLPFKLDQSTKRGKAITVVLFEDLLAVLDSLVVCTRFLPLLLTQRAWIKILPQVVQKFLASYLSRTVIGKYGIKIDLLMEILNTETKLHLNFNKLRTIGARIVSLERMFNTRAGMTRSDDSFEKYLKLKPFYRDQQELLDQYYQYRGLSSQGLLKRKTLKKLGFIGLIQV